MMKILVRFSIETPLAFVKRSAWACGLVWLVGCGSNLPETAAVSGTVLLDGQPVAKARVLFRPRVGGRPAVGRTDDRGRFQLTTFSPDDGALLGQHDVAITKVTVTTASSEPSSPEGLADSLDPKYQIVDTQYLVPKRYGDVKTSTLTANVTSGDNQVRFELATR